MTNGDQDFALAKLTGDRVVLLHGRRGDGLRPGRDVDCLVEGLDPRWPLRLTGSWRLCQWQRYDLGGWYWVVERGGRFLALDTTDDPDGFGRDALRTTPIVEEVNGEPSVLTHAAYVTVKRTRKGVLDPAEWATIGQVASSDPLGFATALERLAGLPFSSLLSPVAIEGVPPARTIVRRANQLRWVRRFGSPPRLARALAMGTRRYVERIWSPTGLSVLIVGPDGSGKSTVATRLPEACAPMFRRVALSHWRPGILPRPGAIVARDRSGPTSPHARDAFGRVASQILLAYYWADFLLGGIVGDLPVKARSGLIVRERGWWDLAVDPQRYRMRIAPGLVRMLGALLPRPDLVIVLHADPELLRDRKQELEHQEIDRQLDVWKTAAPKGAPSVRIDVSRPSEEVLGEAVEAVVRVMESRSVSRLDAGWATLPGRTIRWWLPRGPRGVARTSVSVYQPMTGRARAGWTFGRMLGGTGGFKLLPRGSAPPVSVRRALAPHIPPRGAIAVGRARHPRRFVALVLDERGRCTAFAKIASDSAGADALAAEETGLRDFREAMTGSLVAPGVLHAEPGLLLLKPLEWIPRRRPWELEVSVARSLGEMFRSGRRWTSLGWIGPAHGDCAPWNLLETTRGWALVDWESAGEAPAFHDICHYVAQGHALLGRPLASQVIGGFLGGRGWVGRALAAYAEAADVPLDSAPDALAGYLHRAIRDETWATQSERRGAQRRRRLLERLSSLTQPGVSRS